MQRTQFTFYESFYKAVKRIKDPESRAQAYDAICAYALYGQEPNLDSFSDFSAIAFELIKPNLDSSRKKAENGKAGGSKKQNKSKTKANKKQEQTENEKENKIEKEKENKIEIEKEREYENECYPPTPLSETKGPTLEQVTEFARLRRSSVDPKTFDVFWDAYPRKVGKEAARRAFSKVKADVKTLLSAIDQQKNSAQWQADGGKYIPNPATWLNQGRWEDELPVCGDKPRRKSFAEIAAEMDKEDRR